MLEIRKELILNSDIEKENLFNLGFVYQNYLKDKDSASIYLTELINKYPDDILTKSAKLLLSEGISSNLQDSLIKKSTEESNGNLLKDYALNQNYPNPFNPSTVINYQLPIDGFVTLIIYDILGREVKTLVNEYKPQGKYTVSFDGSKLASGIYFYQLRTGNFVSTKKMLMVK